MITGSKVDSTRRPRRRRFRRWGAGPNAACLAAVLALGSAVPESRAVAAGAGDAPRFIFELEAGPVWQSGNDIQVPNDETGTRFSLVDLAGNGPWPAARLYASWNIAPRHRLRALAAPFSLTETGVPEDTVRFAGGVYNPGVPAEATYKFNSWRLTYAYRFYRSDRWTWWVGFTAKIRDAKVEVRQGDASSRKTDVGFVPLLYVCGDLAFADRWRAVLDIDALAGGPGRAVDGSVKLCADVARNWSLSAGYRTVEGGADVDEVYNFAWLHYAVVSVTYRL